MILKSFLFSALIILISCASKENRAEIFQPEGQAIRGFDAVAFYTDGKPVKGNKAFTFKWKGATWYFSSKSHLDRFKDSPERYAPQYGGYCAYGTADGHKASTETDT